jgi:N-acetylglutamate synthase-like GNAT family acetyltransferase
MFTLRAATRADFPAIRALIRIGQINPIGLDWRRFIVAISPGGEIIGCGQIKPHQDGSMEMASIAVLPERRGQGVARAIIENLMTDFSTASLSKEQTAPQAEKALYLTCRASLGTFYERFGFRVVEESEMPLYFRRLSRLAGVVEALRLLGESMLVMKREF